MLLAKKILSAKRWITEVSSLRKTETISVNLFYLLAKVAIVEIEWPLTKIEFLLVFKILEYSSNNLKFLRLKENNSLRWCCKWIFKKTNLSQNINFA